MGSVVKEKTKKRKNIKKGTSTKSQDYEIDDLIQEELKDEEIRKQRQKELDEITRNTALDLVNEFIENETRSSFKRNTKKSTAKASNVDTEKPVKSKTKKKKAKKETILEMEDHDTKIDLLHLDEENTQSQTSVKSATKKKTKPKQTKNKQKWETFEENSTEKLTSNKEGTEKTTKKTKKPKVNRISPTPPPDNGQQDRKKRISKDTNDLKLQSFSEDTDLEVDSSCLTMLLMAISLESELPTKFYAKLLKSKRFKGALKNMTLEERELVLAMMSDVEPEVDYLPIRNEIFIDSFKDRLTVPT